MGFEIEKIPEEDRKRLGLKLTKNWVIDHERNAFLIRTGGDIEARFYDLHWNDDIVNINVEDTEKPREREAGQHNIYDIDVEFRSIKVPSALKHKTVEILEMVRESIIKHGFACRPEKTGVVTMTKLDESIVRYGEGSRDRIVRL